MFLMCAFHMHKTIKCSLWHSKCGYSHSSAVKEYCFPLWRISTLTLEANEQRLGAIILQGNKSAILLWLTGRYDTGDLITVTVTAINPLSLLQCPTYACRSHSPKLSSRPLFHLVCTFKWTWDIIVKNMKKNYEKIFSPQRYRDG